VHSELVPLLHKCFEPYCSIIHNPTFKDIPLESTEFIIYTNKQLGQLKLEKHNRKQRDVNTIFKTCDEGEIFSFTQEDDKEIDVYTRIKTLVEESETFRCLSLPEREFKLEMASTFKAKLINVTGQKGEETVDSVIIEEIIKRDKLDVAVTVDQKQCKTELLYFRISLEDWWRNKKETMTQEKLRDWLQEVKPSLKLVIRLLAVCFRAAPRSFTEQELSFPKVNYRG
jgi:hypothetical protein